MTGQKRKVVIVGIYLPGIYPSGDDEVVSRLLSAAFLKATAVVDPEIAARYDIEILDITTTTNPAMIAEQIYAHDPYVVAYSVYMWNYDQMVESLKILKSSRPETRVILGGPLVTYTPQEMLQKNPGADIIVCGGAGEIRFKQILKSDLTSAALSRIPMLCYRDENGVILHTGGKIEEDVSQIPSIYETKAHDLNDGRRHTVFVETFRGCPFSCGYCIWGPEDSSIYRFDFDQVLRDIEIIYNNPNVEAVVFTDACLFYTRRRARAICNKIAACSRKIPTVMTLDIHVLDEDMVRHLSKINLYQNQWHFGLQTTNPAALALLERPGGGGSQKFLERIALLRRILPSAEVSFDLIYGLPGDDYEHFRGTTEFAMNLKPSKIHFHPLLLLPGTRFFNEKDKLGFVYDDEPPFMVRANQTFSVDDMRKAIRFVLWTMAALYFPPIRDVLAELHEYKPALRQVDLVETWADIVRRRVNPEESIDYKFTIEANNLARRTFMNILAKPENCVHCYEAMLEVLRMDGGEHLAEDILLGIEFYKAVSRGDGHRGDPTWFQDPHQLVDQGVLNCKDRSKLDYVKTVWVSA